MAKTPISVASLAGAVTVSVSEVVKLTWRKLKVAVVPAAMLMVPLEPFFLMATDRARGAPRSRPALQPAFSTKGRTGACLRITWLLA